MDRDKELLNLIFDVAQDTAPVTVQIGRVINQSCKKGIVIREAPSRIISELVANGYYCDVEKDGGVYVWKF